MKSLAHLLGALAALVLAGAAQAQVEKLADVAAGKKRATVCFACHNEDGQSRNPAYPHLTGQQRAYLEKTLKDFRDGRRQDPTMSAMAKPLSDDDIRNIAAYYASAMVMRR
jgi:cytochrome c553